MSLLAYAGRFTVMSGTGSQAVTGVGFTPKVVLLFSECTTVGITGRARMSTGFDDATTHLGRGVDSVDTLKTAAGGSLTTASMMSVNSAALTPDFTLLAAIQSMDADGFTVGIGLNTLSAHEPFEFLALGGDDLAYDLSTIVAASSTGPQTVSGLSFSPVALIAFYLGTPSAVGPDSWTAWSFVAPTTRAANSTVDLDRPISPAENFRYQREGRAFAYVNPGGTLDREASTVTMTADGYTIDWTTAAGGAVQFAVLALGGVAISDAVVGIATQIAAPGSHVVSVTTGLHPSVVFFSSVGAPTNAAIESGMRFSLGAAASVAGQNGIWIGALNEADPFVTARASSDSAIILATPDTPGSDSSIDGVAALSALGADSFTLDWSVSDGVARDVMFLALGEAAPPPAPPVREAIRFVRVFPHVSEKQMRLFVSRLEFECQRGVGLISGQGEDPKVILSISRDSGKTWGPERFLSMGEIGDYLQRVYTIKLGKAWTFGFKLVVTDPVLVAFLAAYADLEAADY